MPQPSNIWNHWVSVALLTSTTACSDVTIAVVLDKILAESADQRLCVWRIHKHPAAPWPAQPVVIGGVIAGCTDHPVGLRAGRGVQVDPAHDRDSPLGIVGRRVPLVVAGIAGNMGLGDGLPGLLKLFRCWCLAQRTRDLYHGLLRAP